MADRVPHTGEPLTVVGVKTFEKRCDSCKHWEPPDDEFEERPHVLGFGSCKIARSDDGKPDHAVTLAYAADTETYCAWLRTKPEFSCVQWEEKETP